MNTSFSSFTPILLMVNGLVLALALSFLLIILWYDIRRALYQFFGIFLILVVVWNVGFLLSQIVPLLSLDNRFTILVNGIANIGFTGVSAALYALAVVLVGTPTRYFRIIAFFGIMVVVGINIVPLLANLNNMLGNPSSTFQGLSGLFYAFFDVLALYQVWHHRRKIQNNNLVLGIILFVIGQGVGFLNSQLGIASGAMFISSVGVLLMSFAFIRQELITPLINRNQQLESMHEVSLAITTRITTNNLLNEIAERAVTWLGGDASGIFLLSGNTLELATLHNLPDVLLNIQIDSKSPLVGRIAESKKSYLVETYGQDGTMEPAFADISVAFGSLIGSPLIYDNAVIGVLLVIAGKQNRVFNAQDVHLLELLASQAAVAIAYDQLFSNRFILMNQLQLTNEQLRTVLASTESPVIALNRQFNLIFSNRVATQLLQQTPNYTLKRLIDVLPKDILPKNYAKVLRDIRRFGVHVYEISLQDKTYQCHLGCWGYPKIEGWVAVLHDVSELKELDRIKSEMVRMTSHDLKNPLQAALANLDLLRDDLENTMQDQEIALSLNNVEKQLTKMQRIIGGILDLERVRMGVHLNELCQPATIVDNVLDELADIVRDKRIQLHHTITKNLPDFLGDRAQFERALVNLVDNALKFTPSGGQVEVAVTLENDEILFAVKDNGVGIPQELHDKIFERFFRGQQKGIEHISGTGLGLSLVKSVAESHHGRVWVNSQLGKGATFFIAVPIFRELVYTPKTKEIPA